MTQTLTVNPDISAKLLRAEQWDRVLLTLTIDGDDVGGETLPGAVFQIDRFDEVLAVLVRLAKSAGEPSGFYDFRVEPATDATDTPAAGRPTFRVPRP